MKCIRFMQTSAMRIVSDRQCQEPRVHVFLLRSLFHETDPFETNYCCAANTIKRHGTCKVKPPLAPPSFLLDLTFGYLPSVILS
jgi:hypothetical protein